MNNEIFLLKHRFSLPYRLLSCCPSYLTGLTPLYNSRLTPDPRGTATTHACDNPHEHNEACQSVREYDLEEYLDINCCLRWSFVEKDCRYITWPSKCNSTPVQCEEEGTVFVTGSCQSASGIRMVSCEHRIVWPLSKMESNVEIC